jgi:GNAT superfamily N-acetyltransferase
MENETRELFDLNLFKTQSRTLASSPNGIAIELIEHLAERDFDRVIEISTALTQKFGKRTQFTRNTVRKYFNYPKTFPFIVRSKGIIAGFIVGAPLEYFSEESWAQCDGNLGKGNTVYTYAFIVDPQYRQQGLAKLLKRVYQNTLSKKDYRYLTGHVIEGTSYNFTRNSQIVRKFDNWNNTGHTFEYYRSSLK